MVGRPVSWMGLCPFLRSHSDVVVFPTLCSFHAFASLPIPPPPQVMQFGRIDGNAYILDFQYPFSAVQAFAVALANVTQRLK